MFLKPFKLKSNAALKGSETKRLRQRIEKVFPNITSEQLQTLLPNKANATMLKLTTHGDFQTCVFCVDKLPMFFEIEGGSIAPTLYAIWQVPDLIPYFTTVQNVLPKLSNGADLMLPGVIPQGTGMNIYGRYKKGELVAVNLTSNKSAVGVGVLVRSSDDLYMCGGQGSAVKMLHIFGDKLWGIEPSIARQIPNNKPADLTKDDFPALGAETNKNKPSTEKYPLSQNSTSQEEQIVLKTTSTEGDETSILELSSLKISPVGDVVDNNEDEDTDTVLRNAFLAALKNHGKTLTLPILTSNFYRLYVVPEAKTPIDLKKTKYKKLSNFLNQMIEEGFIIVREEIKGVDKISSIDLKHPELVNFITTYKAPEDDPNTQNQPLFHSELTELYIITDETAPFFARMDYKLGEGVPSSLIRKLVQNYISKNNLETHNFLLKSIKLDECLEKICGCPDAPVNKITNILLTKMQHSYQMRSTNDMPSNKPLIEMSLAKRSGNKKVTLVSNIECYGIIIPEFIKLCKQGASASTTTIKLPNQKRDLLQVQGNQIRFVYNLLTETYKIPPKFIIGLKLAAKDDKKKKI